MVLSTCDTSMVTGNARCVCLNSGGLKHAALQHLRPLQPPPDSEQRGTFLLGVWLCLGCPGCLGCLTMAKPKMPRTQF